MKRVKDHNTMMIDIASSITYSEFDEVKECLTAFEMWKKLHKVYGDDKICKQPR